MTTAGPLGVPAFRWLFTGQVISALGDQVFPVAVAALVVSRGGDAGQLGLVLAARFAALVLFAALGGVWADRLPRVRVLRGADALRLVALVGLGAATLLGDPPVPALAALVFVVGAGEAFFRPAYGALLPSVLTDDQLPRGNALSGVTAHIAAVAGPGLAGVLLLVAKPAVLFVVDALTFAVSLATLLRVAEPHREPPTRRPLRHELGEGVAAVRERPWVTAILLMATLQLLLAVAPVTVLLPLVLRDGGWPTSAYGIVLSTGAVGGLLGALMAGRWRPRHPGQAAQLCLLAWVAPPLALIVSSDPRVLAASWFVATLGLGPFIVLWETQLQRAVPRELLARVVSLDWLCSLALLPLGLALTGPAVALVGRGPVLAVSVLAIAVTSLVVLVVPGVRDYASPRRELVAVGAAAG